jgi:DNA-binding phage protein
MKKKIVVEGIKIEDAEIIKTGFFEDYAKRLRKNPRELKEYKKHIIDGYNKTRDTGLFLDSLKIVAMAEGKISNLAKAAKTERSSVYRMLSKNANPSFHSVVSFVHNLGMDFRLSTIVK